MDEYTFKISNIDTKEKAMTFAASLVDMGFDVYIARKRYVWYGGYQYEYFVQFWGSPRKEETGEWRGEDDQPGQV